MLKRRTNGLLSYSIIGIIFLLNFFDYIFDFNLKSLLVLNTQSMTDGFEFWRLISYVTIFSSPETVLLSLVTFLFITPSLEKVFGKYILSLFILLVTFLQGTLLTLVFWHENMIFSGLGGLTIFLLLIHLYLCYPNSFFPVHKKKLFLIDIFTLFFWFSIVLMRFSIKINENFFINDISGLLFGTAAATTVFIQFRPIKKYFEIYDNKNLNIKIPRPEELTPALISDRKFENSESMAELMGAESQKYFIQDEDILNEILDKISDFGTGSLTHEEKIYLHKYSRNL